MDQTFLVLAYITGVILVAYGLFLYLFPSRNLSLILKSISNALSVVNLLFIFLARHDALVIPGMVTTSIGFVRELVYAFKDKSKALQCVAWPIGFSVLFLVSLFWTWSGPLSLLPAVGSVFTSIGFYLSNRKYFKISVIISSALYTTYYVILIFTLAEPDFTKIFPALSSFSGLLSGVNGLIFLLRKEHKEKNKIKKAS